MAKRKQKASTGREQKASMGSTFPSQPSKKLVSIIGDYARANDSDAVVQEIMQAAKWADIARNGANTPEDIAQARVRLLAAKLVELLDGLDETTERAFDRLTPRRTVTRVAEDEDDDDDEDNAHAYDCCEYSSSLHDIREAAWLAISTYPKDKKFAEKLARRGVKKLEWQYFLAEQVAAIFEKHGLPVNDLRSLNTGGIFVPVLAECLLMMGFTQERVCFPGGDMALRIGLHAILERS